jgi:hypothetical protein
MDFKGMDTKATASEPFTGGTVIPEPIYIYKNRLTSPDISWGEDLWA